jgi:hypothetical protein
MMSNGRECANHSCCGQSISPGSLIKLQESEVVVHEVMEYAIRAISLDERSYGCTIGFIPRFLLRNSDYLHGQILQVVLLYDGNFNKSRREYSKHNGGVAYCKFL